MKDSAHGQSCERRTALVSSLGLHRQQRRVLSRSGGGKSKVRGGPALLRPQGNPAPSLPCWVIPVPPGPAEVPPTVLLSPSCGPPPCPQPLFPPSLIGRLVVGSASTPDPQRCYVEIHNLETSAEAIFPSQVTFMHLRHWDTHGATILPPHSPAVMWDLVDPAVSPWPPELLREPQGAPTSPWSDSGSCRPGGGKSAGCPPARPSPATASCGGCPSTGWV